eukprot:1534135-Pyramimonas_sp.AAC.1
MDSSDKARYFHRAASEHTEECLTRLRVACVMLSTCADDRMAVHLQVMMEAHIDTPKGNSEVSAYNPTEPVPPEVNRCSAKNNFKKHR